ncbi:hypothetical protein ACP4OV_002177 [Aristida adscensionis]
MAAVLDALAPYVKELIAGMAEDEVRMLLGVSGEIDKLEENLDNLKAFLADAERRRLTDEGVQKWVRKLKGAMYDATDLLDLCQLEADKRRGSNGGGGDNKEKAPKCLQPLLFCLQNPVYAHKIGKRIKELNQRLDDVRKGAQDFSFNINLSSYQEQRLLTDAPQHSSYKMTSEFSESAIVGEKIERDAKDLVQVLTTDDKYNNNIKVASIVGVGGMGKTTLAQKIFKETTIQEYFKIKIWLSITQNFNETELLRTAISHAEGHHGGVQDKTQLMRTLTEALSKERFLIVMDDMWSEKPWNDVLNVPITNASQKQPGSRVLVTTRSEHLPQQMRASLYTHRVTPLDEEDAWSLLKKQLRPDQAVGVDQLKDVGMRIVEKCGGLPLAIKVMGGLLSTRYPNQHDWEDVLNDAAWSVAGLPKDLDHRIYLSYADLTPQLKQCFLYCVLFPKGTSIWMIEAIRMWISEGFIQPQEGSSSHNDRVEEVATKYYRELITRNLIEPTPASTMTGYECTMHDVIRSFAEFMAREESLVILGEQAAGGHDNSLMRHLSIGSTESLLELIESLSELKHLRYLQLEETNISKLPDNIHRLKFLQHMVLNGCSNLDHLPSSITELVHLRTLDMEHSKISLVPKGLGGLTNLRMLKGFPVHMDLDRGWCNLEEIASLSQLRDLTIKGLENVTASSFAEKAVISNKRYLSYLEMNCTGSRFIGLGDEMEQKQQVIEEVYDKLCPPICIENLIMQRYFGRRLPKWMSAPATVAFTSLRFLQFVKLSCCTKLPDGLCQLPCLEGFRIEGAPAIERVGHQFQAPFSLAVGGGAIAASAPFPKLRALAMHGLSEWEEWEWEEQGGEDAAADTIAMPSLERLNIDYCKLSRLPPGLANSKRHALRELWLCRITNLTSVENFPSVVDLDVLDCAELRRINCLSRLQNIRIIRCPKVEVLEDVPVLDTLKLEDATMETLPGYLRGVSPRYLELGCSKELYETILLPGSSESDKISHIKKRKIYWLRR